MSSANSNYSKVRNLLKKNISVKKSKIKHHNWILHIRIISLYAKFQLKLKILISWTKFAQTRVFLVKNRKREHHHCILHIRISLRTKIHYKETIFNLGPNLPKKGFWSKTKKMRITIEFRIFKLVWAPNFILNKQFWILVRNLPKKSIFHRKRKKTTIEICISAYHICLGNNFQRRLTILIFWTRFAQKGCFRSKTEKVNTTMEFCIFNLV